MNNKSMRILSITAQKPHSTGSGTYLTELVNSFDRAGHEQAVVCGLYPDDSVSFPCRVSVYPVRFSHERDTGVQACEAASFISYPIVGMSDTMPYPSTRYCDLTDNMISEFESSFICAIDRAVSEFRPDIILCHHLFLLTSMVRKRYPDITLYGLCHGSDLRQFINCTHLQDRIRPEIAALDRIFALHDEQKKKICRLFGEECKDRIFVIGSGYNAALFNTDGRIERSADQPVRISYAGKMSEAKGVPELLEVLEELSSEHEFTAVLAGGCQDEDIKSKLENLPENIKYRGQVPQSELAAVFRSSDIFVLPSFYEGLPLVLIEAMASGMLPISTDIPGTRDWINKNVSDPNVRYIPMPEMEAVDVPTRSGRENFRKDLKEILGAAIEDLSCGTCGEAARPDTSRISWDAVAASIVR